MKLNSATSNRKLNKKEQPIYTADVRESKILKIHLTDHK